MNPIRLLLCAAAVISIACAARGGEVRLQGQAFLLDGKPFDMWGIRVGSASQSQELTDHLIAQLDDYARHGVNTVSVYCMGTSGGYSDPFTPDGSAIDPAHLRRMEQILRACDRRGMVVVVGVFYQRSDRPSLRDWDACKAAVGTVVRALKPHANVILNIANEQNSAGYARLPWARVRQVPDLLDLCRLAKTADPDRLVGAGGYDHRNNEEIGRSKDVDVLLFDTAGTRPTSAELYERFVKAGVTGKPIVNVETFGGWTKQFAPQGVFPEDVKRAYLAEVEAAARVPGLYVHFHNNPWCQAAERGERIRYDLGGRGTKEDPGIRWYFEAVRSARRDRK